MKVTIPSIHINALDKKLSSPSRLCIRLEAIFPSSFKVRDTHRVVMKIVANAISVTTIKVASFLGTFLFLQIFWIIGLAMATISKEMAKGSTIPSAIFKNKYMKAIQISMHMPFIANFLYFSIITSIFIIIIFDFLILLWYNIRW